MSKLYIISVLLLLFSGITLAQDHSESNKADRPRNVILMIGDGMG